MYNGRIPLKDFSFAEAILKTLVDYLKKENLNTTAISIECRMWKYIKRKNVEEVKCTSQIIFFFF